MCLMICFGRHRSVLLANLLEHFLAILRLHVRVRHLCSAGWDHLCERRPPCQACAVRWHDTFHTSRTSCSEHATDMASIAQNGYVHFQMAPLAPGKPPGHAMLPLVVPRFEEDARPPTQRPATPPAPKARATSVPQMLAGKARKTAKKCQMDPAVFPSILCHLGTFMLPVLGPGERSPSNAPCISPRHCNTMDSPYIPSDGRGGSQPADEVVYLDRNASMENLRELHKYSEKLQFEATCCRLWANGTLDRSWMSRRRSRLGFQV